MGSFNTTCLVSQQTIVPHAQCVIIPIKQQSTFNPVSLTNPSDKSKSFLTYGVANSTCYPTCFWSYSGPLIYGSYDDYGQFELNESSINEAALIQFFNHLFDNALQTNSGENQYHDIPLDFQSLYSPSQQYSFSQLLEIWEKIWTVSQEHRLFVFDYNRNPRPLQFAVIHHLAAEYLINSYSSIIDYNKQSYEQKSYFHSYVTSVFTRITEFFKNHNKDTLNHSFFVSKIATLQDFRIGQQEGAHFSNYYNNYDTVMDIIEKYFKQNPNALILSDSVIDELFKHLYDQIQHCYLHAGLDLFNIRLSPMVYSGQDYDNSEGKSFAKMIKSVSASINKEIKSQKF